MEGTTPTEGNQHRFGLNLLLLARVWRAVKPYWTRPRPWLSYLLAAIVLTIVLTQSGLSIWVSFRNRDLVDAFVARRADLIWPALTAIFVVGLLTGLLQLVSPIAQTFLIQHWRRWQSARLIDKYLSARTYYDISLRHDIDNPDQRIQTEVNSFVSTIVGWPLTLIQQLTNIVGSLAIILIVDRRLLPFAIGFAVVQWVVNYFLLRPLIRMNYQVSVAEADYRFGLVRVRENAEAIAFYQGEPGERGRVMGYLATAIRSQLRVIFYEQGFMRAVQLVFSTVLQVLPYLVLLPPFLHGDLTYGQLTQTTMASMQLAGSLAGLTTILSMLAGIAPSTMRMEELEERADAAALALHNDDIPRIAVTRGGDHVVVEKLTLQTPGGDRTLVRNLSLRLGENQSLAVMGETGVGKSSLLRAMAGLWHRGEGHLEMPPPEACLFLPQRPYLLPGDLRAQLIYPFGRDDLDDAALQEVLNIVNLPHLAEQYGGLDAVRDWDKVLSPGEQQRIGFARVLVSRPRFVFLDESTSAVDLRTEAELYRALASSGASFVSVGHRLSILNHHTHILTLLPEGRWTFGELGGADRGPAVGDERLPPPGADEGTLRNV